MTKKSNKNSIKLNHEKKVVRKKSKRLATEKSTAKKKLSKTGKTDAATLLESCSVKATNAIEIPQNSIIVTGKPQLNISKVTPTPPEPVFKALQPLSTLTNISAASRIVSIPNPLVQSTPPSLESKMLNSK